MMNRLLIRKATGAGARPDEEDSRLATFKLLLDAIDAGDWREGQIATRKLRSIGFSVCIIKPRGPEGAR
jgi:hypothetical protein